MWAQNDQEEKGQNVNEVDPYRVSTPHTRKSNPVSETDCAKLVSAMSNMCFKYKLTSKHPIDG